MINENEFLRACVGVDEDNSPKSAVSCTILMYESGSDVNDPLAFSDIENKYKNIGSRYTNNAVIGFVRCGEFVHVILKFNSAFDPDFRNLWLQLETYGELLEEYNIGNEKRIPIISYNIVPKEYSSQAYLNFSNPIYWHLQPKAAGEEKCSVIKMLFKLDSFSINETPKEINLKDEEAATNRIYRVIRTEK